MADSIKSLLGETVHIKCTVGVSSSQQNKIVLEGLIINGDIPKNHAWVHRDKRFTNILEGDVITLTATIVEYQGIDEKKKAVITKYGFEKIRNIRREENA